MRSNQTRKWLLKAEPTCTWCGIETSYLGRVSDKFHYGRTLDHKEVRSQGGSDAKINMRIACTLCNRVRGRDPEPAFEIVCETLIKPHRHDLRAMVKAFIAAEMTIRAAHVIALIAEDDGQRAALFHELGGVNDLMSPGGRARERQRLLYHHRLDFEMMPSEDIMEWLQSTPAVEEGDHRNFDLLDAVTKRKAATAVLKKRVNHFRKQKGPPEGDPLEVPVPVAHQP